MWSARSEPEKGGRVLRFALDRGGEPAPFSDVIRGWQSDAAFREFTNGLLAAAPFAAFRWETPPVTATTLDRPFEFVLLDSPGLARQPDREAFAEHFGTAPDDVVAFANLGGDAFLVAPTPRSADSAYGHIAAFVREAPQAQRHALWAAVGNAMGRRVGLRPVWLSTAGAGVSWLHVRLDDRPKYYGYEPYREAA